MPPSKTKGRIQVTLSTTNTDWFYNTFGEDASISWYIDLCLSAAKSIHEDTGVNVKAVVKDAAKEVNEETSEMKI